MHSDTHQLKECKQMFYLTDERSFMLCIYEQFGVVVLSPLIIFPLCVEKETKIIA